MKKKTIIVTAGPTNERIDSVMKITNMSTGSLGCTIAKRLLEDPCVGKLIYLAPKLAHRPDTTDTRFQYIETFDADSMLNTLRCLLSDPDRPVDAVVHSAAVGDYKARYSVRGEDLAREIAKRVMDTAHASGKGTWFMDPKNIEASVMDVIENPACAVDDSGKMSSYEPNLMVMMNLTPKVVGCVKKTSPETMLVMWKLLDGVSDEHLFDVASALRRKNDADFVVANDLSRIGDGRHWAMVIGPDENNPDGPDRVVATCETKIGIADAVAGLVLTD